MRVGGHLDRWAGRLGPPLAAALAFLLFLGAIGVGLRVAPFGLLFPFGRAPALDYSAGPLRGISPLEPNFIKNVLGDFLAEAPQAVEAVEAPKGAARHNVRLPVPAEPISETHPLTNDDFAAARQIPSVPYQAKTNTTKASSEPGEPSECGPLGGTVWYRYSATRDIGLIANTFGSNYPIALGVFSGKPGDLTNIECDTDVRGDAIIPFPAKKSTTYFFQIAGPRGGDLVFNLEQQAKITLESVSSSGEPANRPSGDPVLSADGRYLAFRSSATNLVTGSDGSWCTLRDPGPGLPYVLTARSLSSPCEQIIVRDRVTGTMSLASVTSAGEPANGHSWHPAISADGRYVAFSSPATNLVTGDTNDSSDIFVHDLLTRRTERVSVSSSGRQLEDLDGENGAESPSVSSDGRYVVFESSASNLVARDTNAGPDVFVRDRLTRTTERVSVSSSEEEAEPIGSAADYTRPASDPHRASPCISPDGRFVAFRSSASNLVLDDSNRRADVFVRDLLTRRTVRVSVRSDGKEADGDSGSFGERSGPCVSADGRYVVFRSEASNLVAWDSNGAVDVFVHDLALHRTVRASVSSSGVEANLSATNPTISADGRYVAFQSKSSTLAPGDTNERLDVFVHDLHTRTTIRVSVTPAGEALDEDAANPSLSSDGSLVAFDAVSATERYTEGDSVANVFAHERPRRMT